MNTVVVSVADCQVSNDQEALLVTYALGSCIGLVVYDPIARVGGMLHYMLPESHIDRAKAEANPYMFADTGIPLLFKRTYQYGAQKGRMLVWAAGGAQPLQESGIFDIGKRNQLALRKILWRAGVMLSSEEVGGSHPRTMRLGMETGQCWLREGNAEREMAVHGRRKEVGSCLTAS